MDEPTCDGKEHNVVEVPPPPITASWQKSRVSGGGDCVEVSRSAEYVWVRDSKNRDGAILGFTRKEWAAFLAGARAGEFDLPA